MPSIKISVNYDSERLSAINQFSSSDSPKIEQEIFKTIEKIYTKTVPLAVRQYIDAKENQCTTNKKGIKTIE